MVFVDLHNVCVEATINVEEYTGILERHTAIKAVSFSKKSVNVSKLQQLVSSVSKLFKSLIKRKSDVTFCDFFEFVAGTKFWIYLYLTQKGTEFLLPWTLLLWDDL